MRFSLTALAITMLGACAVQTYRPPSGNTAYGSYPYKQVLSESNPPMTLEGTVVLLPDTVMMTLWGKSCSPGSTAGNGGGYSYNCGDISFRLTKANPLRTASYRAPTSVWKTRQICDAYRENPTTKAEQCTRYRQERYESRVVLQGSLSFLPR